MFPLSSIRFFTTRAYKILGLKPTCTLQQAKSAYYKQAQIHHPDKNPNQNSKQKFSSINEQNIAYNQIVNDIQNGRAATNSFSQQSFTRTTSSKYTTYETQKETKTNASFRWKQYYRNPDNFYEERFDDLMREFMMWEAQQKQQKKEQKERAKKKRQQRQAREEEKVKQKSEDLDVHSTIQLTNSEFKTGCTKEITVQRKIPCECPQTKKNYCKICRGSGFKQNFFMQGLGFAEQVCECMKRKRNPKCIVCNGKGFRVKSTIQLIRIPRNSQPNQTLKVAGKGSIGEELIGNLIITLIGKVKGQKIDFDLHSTQNISMAQAVLGDTINIQTLNGKIELSVPKGFSSGNVIPLKGYGYLRDVKKNIFGDHYVKIIIKTPDTLSIKQQNLYRQILELQKTNGKQSC